MTVQQIFKKAEEFYRKGDMKRAAAGFHAVLQQKPEHADAANMLGVVALQTRNLPQAENLFRKALDINDKNAGYWLNLGVCRLQMGHPDKAVSPLRKALRLRPGFVDALVSLADALSRTNDLRGAVSQLHKALKIQPDDPRANQLLGWIEAQRRNYRLAEQAYRKAVKYNPRSLASVTGLAHVLSQRAMQQQAWEVMEPYIEKGDTHPDLLLIFGNIAARVDRAESAAEKLEKMLEDPDKLRASQHIEALYTLAKLYDSLGDYDRAFTCAEKANNLNKEKRPEKKNIHAVNEEMVQRVFTAETLQQLPAATYQTERPIFIIGMPRSGTTLVEQILAAHPQVFAAGEIYELRQIINSIPHRLSLQAPFEQCVAQLNAKTINSMASSYDKALKKLSGNAPRVTDKMPGNYMLAGFIQLLFPAAKVIHCRRHPLDTCLSCYLQDFGVKHPYSRDLQELGEKYIAYERLMKHWENILDLPLHHVRYEDLVNNQEEESRRLLEFCDLPWDDACLRFHEVEREVLTLSYQQVRRPMYKSSLARYKNYQQHLEPLRNMLAEYIQAYEETPPR